LTWILKGSNVFRKLVFTLGILAVGVSQAQEITVVQTPAMSGNFAHPAMKDCPMRPYPADSVQKGEVGDVVLDVLVDATSGRPRDSKVVISSGYRSLDMAAVFSLARCTFVLDSIDRTTKPGRGFASNGDWMSRLGKSSTAHSNLKVSTLERPDYLADAGAIAGFDRIA
jgi:TonB family protein